MSEPMGHTSVLVFQIRTGDESARNELITHTCERLRKLTAKMMKGYPSLWRVEEPDDVLQNALIRLDTALRFVMPESTRHFTNLASLQIRRELHELARSYRGRYGARAKELTNQDGNESRSGPLDQMTAPSGEPSSLEKWTEFHKHAEELPDQERDVFQLLWYFGMAQEEAAEVLEISLRTLKRRWHRVRCFLVEKMDSEQPE